MLLQEKMKNTKFSPNEEIVIDFILTKQERIKDYSTTMIAGETYTSPSLLVRISKKLGFSGYNNFKNAFLEEVQYLHKSHLNIDANQPFLKTDSIMNIANKITQLKTESLNDTLSLFHHDTLQKAILLKFLVFLIYHFQLKNLFLNYATSVKMLKFLC